MRSECEHPAQLFRREFVYTCVSSPSPLSSSPSACVLFDVNARGLHKPKCFVVAPLRVTRWKVIFNSQLIRRFV